MSNIKRRWVTLGIDLIVDIPEGLDEMSQEGQDYLREIFIDYLQSAQYIQLGFEVGEVDDDNDSI